MQLSAIHETLAASNCNDWHHIVCGPGPSYKQSIVTDVYPQAQDQDQQVVNYILQHHELAVYKPDVSLSMAWGYDYTADTVQEALLGNSKDRRVFEFTKNFPDSSARCFLLDIFWNGSLVHREHLISVDGCRANLPIPRTDRNGEEYFEKFGVSLARLVTTIELTVSDFEEYLTSSKIPVREI